MSDTPSLPSQIGTYRVERELGRGGMGIVYLGRDARLDRPVAIKVLPEAFANDPERLARFEREARLLASLTHPNIAGIFGLEESGGRRFLVLEYVEGETLAERIARGALPVDDAVDACRQIAAALEGAHESGVVHRDLKPGNVKLMPSGEVKVLDFGLAKGGTGSGSGSDPSLTASPTMAASAMTGVGVILGTAAYMSPEQARGRAVDRRTDIWSFGCVLFECLTGRQAFNGETVSDMIALILQGEPNWKALPVGLPLHLRSLLERCLTKDPKRRLRDIGEARLLLEGVVGAANSGTSSPSAAAVPARGARLPWAIAAGFSLTTAALAVLLVARAPARAPVLRVSLAVPTTPNVARDGAFLALSPDGTMLASSALDSAGGSRLWLRALDAVEGRLLAGTEDAAQPVWSPDGRYLAFTTQDKLKKLDPRGGSPEILCPLTSYGRGVSWGSRGVIVFSGGAEGPIFKVSQNGGTPTQATTLDSGETGHRFPRFLPDGRHFLFASMPPRADLFTIFVASTDSPKRERLMVADGSPVYVEPGYLLFKRNGRVVAQRFDAGRRKLIGEPVPLPDEPERTDFFGSPSLTASHRGSLAYYRNQISLSRLAWLDRSGRVLANLPVPEGAYESAVLSPDGKTAAVVRATSADASDVWLLDIARGSMSRLTFLSGRVDRPVWSPDGARIAFASNRDGRWDVFEKAVDGSGSEIPLVAGGSLLKYPSAYSADGKTLLFEQISERTGWDVWSLPLEGDRVPKPLLSSPYDEQFATLTRDGRWLAFTSNESGRPEIHAQEFLRAGRRYMITTNGGSNSQWRADGREISCLSGPNFVMIPVDPSAGFATGTPETHPIRGDVLFGSAASDLSRVLVVMSSANARVDNDVTLVLNWRSALERR